MAWYNPFSWGEKKSKVVTQPVVDPTKQKVAHPLSTYLAGQVGKGATPYGGDLYAPMEDYLPKSSYSEFLSMKPSEWFEEAIATPEMKRFKEEMLPEIREGYAGSLRGSGRFRAEEAGIEDFSEYLTAKRTESIPQIATQQLSYASALKAQRDADYTKQYKEWMRTLPEYNPNLDRALSFLGKPTGTDTMAWLDTGQEGWFADLLGTGLSAAGTYFGSKELADALAKYKAT